MMDADSNPPKILCAMIPVVTVKSGLNTMVAHTEAPRANAIGTPMIKKTAMDPNSINAVDIMPPPPLLYVFL